MIERCIDERHQRIVENFFFFYFRRGGGERDAGRIGRIHVRIGFVVGVLGFGARGRVESRMIGAFFQLLFQQEVQLVGEYVASFFARVSFQSELQVARKIVPNVSPFVVYSGGCEHNAAVRESSFKMDGTSVDDSIRVF